MEKGNTIIKIFLGCWRNVYYELYGVSYSKITKHLDVTCYYANTMVTYACAITSLVILSECGLQHLVKTCANGKLGNPYLSFAAI